MSAEKTDTFLHLLHLVDDALYGVAKVSVEFTIVCLYGTGLGMIGTGQKLILQIELNGKTSTMKPEYLLSLYITHQKRL